MTATSVELSGEVADRAGEERVWCCLAFVVSSVAAMSVSLSAGVVVLLLALGVLVTWSDVVARRIPNLVVATMVLFSVTAVGLSWPEAPPMSVLLGAVLGGVPLAVIHAISPKSIGFGDVKLVVGIGAVLGVVGWALVWPCLVAASVLGLVGFITFTSWRSSIPYGACLAVASSALVVAEQLDLIHLQGKV